MTTHNVLEKHCSVDHIIPALQSEFTCLGFWLKNIAREAIMPCHLFNRLLTDIFQAVSSVKLYSLSLFRRIKLYHG
jgi:hypothetical protein